METRLVKRVNDVNILVSNDTEQLVPIKPICEALGIDPESQRKKIKEHYIFKSITVLSTVVAGDGKEREMVCLPIGYALGWLLTINPANVSEEARDSLIRYQTECYTVLLNYFQSRALFVEHKQKEIDKQQEIVDEAKNTVRTAKDILSEAENKLKKIKSLTLNEYDAEKRQFKLDF